MYGLMRCLVPAAAYLHVPSSPSPNSDFVSRIVSPFRLDLPHPPVGVPCSGQMQDPGPILCNYRGGVPGTG